METLSITYFGKIEVKTNSEMGDKFMVQFVCGADLVQEKEVVSAVNYPVLLIPLLTRPSTLTFVSFISLHVLAIANTLY
jgi:hypothetical protein